MLRLGKAAPLLLAAALAGQERFDPGPITSYPARESNSQVTVAVRPYRDREQLRKIFGKTDFDKLGIVPLLVVIANESEQILRLDSLRVQLITADGQKVEPIPAADVTRPGNVKRPEINPRPSPIPGIGRRRSPREAPEVAQREFVAPLVEAHATEHGFFYFRLGKGPDRLAGAKIYVTGIREVKSGQELFYFEIGLDKTVRN
jgi:hypothetical protein